MTRLVVACLGISLVTALVVGDDSAPAEPNKKTRSQSNVQFLMRDKLEHAQNLLEGIVTEDFDQIAESGEWMRMISRAYHDCLFMAQVCPSGMIFIPCRDGVSHRPEEFAAPAAIDAGVEVLAHTLLQLAEN